MSISCVNSPSKGSLPAPPVPPLANCAAIFAAMAAAVAAASEAVLVSSVFVAFEGTSESTSGAA